MHLICRGNAKLAGCMGIFTFYSKQLGTINDRKGDNEKQLIESDSSGLCTYKQNFNDTLMDVDCNDLQCDILFLYS